MSNAEIKRETLTYCNLPTKLPVDARTKSDLGSLNTLKMAKMSKMAMLLRGK